MITELVHLDQWLFFQINHMDIEWLNQIMPFFRHKLFWIPLYLFLIAFTLGNFKKKGIWLIMFAVITVAASDQVSAQWIKKSVKRMRPCNDPQIQAEVHNIVRCGGGYSFPSAHATNHMAVAIFFIFTLGKFIRYLSVFLFFWAVSIGFAQIYVGVHYPFDVFAGLIIGVMIGWPMQKIFWKLYPGFGQIQSN